MMGLTDGAFYASIYVWFAVWCCAAVFISMFFRFLQPTTKVLKRPFEGGRTVVSDAVWLQSSVISLENMNITSGQPAQPVVQY